VASPLKRSFEGESFQDIIYQSGWWFEALYILGWDDDPKKIQFGRVWLAPDLWLGTCDQGPKHPSASCRDLNMDRTRIVLDVVGHFSA
jgi:hypothetical protein